jgi:DNA-binding PadR family transcriptional regulator
MHAHLVFLLRPFSIGSWNWAGRCFEGILAEIAAPHNRNRDSGIPTHMDGCLMTVPPCQQTRYTLLCTTRDKAYDSRMYKDNSLIPSEAVRLAALGLLWQGERSYADLAREIRHFIGRIVGPSLELLGPSLELFKIEGLIEASDPREPADDQMMRLTEEGRAELHRLMTTRLRGPMGEVNRLIIAFKMHFLACLPPSDKNQQLTLMIEACDKELVRLADLRSYPPLMRSDSNLASWLDLEIAEIEGRRRWFSSLQATLST